MNTPITIRPAEISDADAISRVIKSALRISNAQDYPASVIDRLVKYFDPEDIKGFIQHREVFVALNGFGVVGTASLDRNTVRSVFIAPDMQRLGIGRRLMARVEHSARSAAVPRLIVPSSITAVSFYEKLGFHRVKEVFRDEELTIVLERELAPLS